jgi:hypothetical protein
VVGVGRKYSSLRAVVVVVTDIYGKTFATSLSCAQVGRQESVRGR